MVCYARPAGWLAVLLIGALLVFSGPAGHFLDTAALVVAATVATGGAAIAAALLFAAFMSAQRRRASAGGCVSCQFRCQHAMTGPSRRPWLVTTADRAEPRLVTTAGRAEPAGRAGPFKRAEPLNRAELRPARVRLAPSSTRPGPVLLPIPPVRSARRAGVAPRWPDQPLHRIPGQPARVVSPT